ncbi:MAG: excinuclease ABC subunit B [Candidatus Doudnabacteria bacterium RIFCSPHIGHO2_02_FULL_48_21]|uniref:UvrABC system protein B n=1 Tax=Candidatus Doudnabacteria bacterium RIFCSPLOWO2_02_FULL_48_13 TaxID=1817845 RepID=A0A1F5QCG7_9BACT|nr:MAG: excinuclease ABC subunit B [Candidatus Doudnabacteria bacterium RIFCSPHIGHO2_01_48_18]OGE79665.1 MAG: excinuclease ABC subunit B [Candidatus Doudnabacteria bacterium RIFCSPHIGHO2_01_FULL_48_180]OGE91465.1 MAG: excinuclease ABC subunit B [Candidatus Doudnabacteria bacterium RIFCSPHIGHO2_12_FULL_47_25]OGE93080.1 MAG: excinuclease ABC subunit B [Candidatus Doudnabacteria bacterium RIFCSPHIGHO2_02_FULL_48_21]OGE98087.1 MAG: excinuclease ABC subunit B [Candidatus Doudnabacteria bacterium RIF
MRFRLQSKFQPTGDQPQAIEKLVQGVKKDHDFQTLLGATGSGKTFTMANVIAQIQKPTLVISHNKTLTAQLASEFQEFFPENAVHYFVSYYDYYQPEAYIPRTDTYIEKETDINEEIDRLRNAATQSLLSRKDVIIVASVSCIYGLGNPANYLELSLELQTGQDYKRDKLLRRLVDLQYIRNDVDLRRGSFRVRGDVLEIVPAHEDRILRMDFFGDTLEKISEFDALTGGDEKTYEAYRLFPAKHFITSQDKIQLAVENIRQELEGQLKKFKTQGKLLEAQRLQQRTNFDIEMLTETGYVNGIENYSRQLDFRKPGEPPSTLLDYFPDDFLLFIDESHITVPQIRAMYEGDRSRKQTLIDYGFRLPSAIDNRPLKYQEFMKKLQNTIFVSATPTDYETGKSKQIAEQLIRPTGLLDPEIEIKPTKYQVDDLMEEIQKRVKKNQRVLITTLTKRMAEELSEYLKENGIKGHYLHSEVDTFERLEILRDLRLGVYDVIVGINLLREGLDLPEVSLVAILDADKEGFLRSKTSFLQIMGRAARHSEGHVIMYADRTTGSMKEAITEVERRRTIQEEYNQKHGITPTTIQKSISESRLAGAKAAEDQTKPEFDISKLDKKEVRYFLEELKDRMDLASKNLEFEKAAMLRDQIIEINKSLKRKKHKL